MAASETQFKWPPQKHTLHGSLRNTLYMVTSETHFTRPPQKHTLHGRLRRLLKAATTLCYRKTDLLQCTGLQYEYTLHAGQYKLKGFGEVTNEEHPRHLQCRA